MDVLSRREFPQLYWLREDPLRFSAGSHSRTMLGEQKALALLSRWVRRISWGWTVLESLGKVEDKA
jgi:hypothetical protein